MTLPNLHRRSALQHFAALTAACLPALASTQALATPGIAAEVWKDPHCGCCQDWVLHMQNHGFTLTVHNSGNHAVRTQLGLPSSLGSCHTALIAGYVVEGHVPAADAHKLLRLKPNALGITVPGMPIGSPGMDGAIYNGRKDSFDVLLVTKRQLPHTGVDTSIFTSYR